MNSAFKMRNVVLKMRYCLNFKCCILGQSLGIVAFNYKTEDTLDALARLCPTGVDIYFDNVGGPTVTVILNFKC